MSEISFYDTSTRPTEAMRDAMRDAPVGDDMYGADPTVNELEAEVARLLGKEAAVLVPSGTMANLIAMMVLCRPGDEVIAEQDAHVVYYEAGGMAALAGVMPRTVPGDHGVLRPELIEPYLRGPNQHYPPTRLLFVENTHNRAGGTVTTVAEMAALRELCDARGIALHVDGARLPNAAAALGVPPAALAAGADSVTICLTKGLSAPVGSVLAGSREYIDEARRARKILGGAMRQAGVFAAAGLVALRDQLPRLGRDHALAERLAAQLGEIRGIGVDPIDPRTNMVMIDVSQTGLSAGDVAARLAAAGIKASARPPWTIRFVTHREVGEPECDRLVEALRGIASETASSA
jgi:threonine aldolase